MRARQNILTGRDSIALIEHAYHGVGVDGELECLANPRVRQRVLGQRLAGPEQLLQAQRIEMGVDDLGAHFQQIEFLPHQPVAHQPFG